MTAVEKDRPALAINHFRTVFIKRNDHCLRRLKDSNNLKTSYRPNLLQDLPGSFSHITVDLY